MLKLGISLADIKEMSEDEFNEYFTLLGIMEEEVNKK